jgi:hypothetical protein
MNKKLLIIGLVVIVMGIIVTVSSIIVFLPISVTSGSYILATPFPEVNDSYPVYKIITPNITEEDVKRIGTLFNLSGDVKDYNLSGTFKLVDNSKDPEETLEVNRISGSFSYRIEGKDFPKSTDPLPELPSDEEARTIATQYLLERDLLPDDVHFVSVGPKTQGGESGPYSYPLYTFTKYVSFAKEIQGLRAYNSGIGVTIGDKGEVVGVGNSLKQLEPEPAGYVKIITPEQAYKRLLSDDLVVLPLSGREGVVRTISLGYWMGVTRDPQKYILPVYVFSTDSRWFYVWAVDPSGIDDLQ